MALLPPPSQARVEEKEPLWDWVEVKFTSRTGAFARGVAAAPVPDLYAVRKEPLPS